MKALGKSRFGLPKAVVTFLTISFGKEPGNFLLKDYVWNRNQFIE